jgi:hypothetical protein
VLTGLVTYLIQVVNALDELHRFSMAVHDESAGGRGAAMVVRALRYEEPHVAGLRLDRWAEHARSSHDKLRRLPLLACLYRSRDSLYDPESAFAGASEAAVAALLAARQPEWRGMYPAAQHLAAAVTRLQTLIAEQYLGKDLHHRLQRPSPEGGDAYRCVAPDDGDTEVTNLAFRSREFLRALPRTIGTGPGGDLTR